MGEEHWPTRVPTPSRAASLSNQVQRALRRLNCIEVVMQAVRCFLQLVQMVGRWAASVGSPATRTWPVCVGSRGDPLTYRFLI